MTDISFTAAHAAPPAQDTARDVALPQPQPFGAPVFINDCASPLAGETVLSLLMKRLARDD